MDNYTRSPSEKARELSEALSADLNATTREAIEPMLKEYTAKVRGVRPGFAGTLRKAPGCSARSSCASTTRGERRLPEGDTPRRFWIASVGGRPMDERATDCGIIYYSSYYGVRAGATLPDLPFIPGPRGDLGYGSFATFPGDNGTFAALIAIPPGDQELKVLREPRAFEAATRTMPPLDAWTNTDTAEPITGVLPMGSLQNTIRTSSVSGAPLVGLVSVGDSVCHTDPVASLGLSFALIHARHLASALRDYTTDLTAATLAFTALATPEMEERFEYLSAIDDTRTRLWSGERVDYTHRDGGSYAFFTFAANGVAPLADGDVFRVLVRRNAFLDRLSVLDKDEDMQERLEQFYANLAAANRPRPGPPREELLDVMSAAVA